MASHARDVNSFCEIFFPLCPPPFPPPAFARVTTRARDVGTAGVRVISSPTRSRARRWRVRVTVPTGIARVRVRVVVAIAADARAREATVVVMALARHSLASRARMSTDASRGPRVRLRLDETRAIGETKPPESDARGSVPLESPLETLEEDELVVECVGPRRVRVRARVCAARAEWDARDWIERSVGMREILNASLVGDGEAWAVDTAPEPPETTTGCARDVAERAREFAASGFVRPRAVEETDLGV